MKKSAKKVRIYFYQISLILIVLLAIFLRFYNYDNRWGLAYDQARDSIVSHQILEYRELPIIGPFSASGRFVFGPIWYWFHALFTAINPSSVNFIWIVQTTISSLMPLAMFFLGKKTFGKKFGLLLAFFTAISTAQIAQSTNLTYSTFVGFIAVFILFFLVFFLDTGRKLFLFLTSFLIGLAMNVHFQSAGYFFLLAILLVLVRKSFRNLLLIILGFLIPFIPLLIFDFITDHFQSRQIFNYLASSGEPVSIQKRWLTYLGVYWTNAYSHIIGGYWYIGIMSAFTGLFIIIRSVLKKQIPKIVFIVGIFLILNIILLRYFKGNAFDAFLVYLHPFILFLTSWVIFKTIKLNKYLGIFLLCLITIVTLFKDKEEIMHVGNHITKVSESHMNTLKEEFPTQKFAVYDHNFKTPDRSYPTILYLMKNNLIDDNGKRVGYISASDSAGLNQYKDAVILGNPGYYLVDLSNYSKEELESENWYFINPSSIYKSILYWYEDEELLR